MNPNTPITEADLHAFIDAQLSPERQREVQAYLANRPEETQRAQAYREQKSALRSLFDPVLDETPPARLLNAGRPRMPWYQQRAAAGIAIALLSGAAGWGLRGGLQAATGPDLLARQGANSITLTSAAGFAQRAAVAHAVYSPDQRRPVEVDAAHEEQLVAWLSKRMGTPMKPPHLQALGYALEGGRLLPGGRGPVAQFMYSDAAGAKLTVYVSNEVAAPGQQSEPEPARSDTRFRFTREGAVNVFYWTDGPWGYAISAGADRAELARVSNAIYSQLGAPRRP